MSFKPGDITRIPTITAATRSGKGHNTTSRTEFQETLQKVAKSAFQPADLAALARLQALRCTLDSDEAHSSASGFAPLIERMLTDRLQASQKYSTMSESRPAPTPVNASRPSFSLNDESSKGPFDRMIAQASRQFGIAPKVIRAVIRAESNFDPQAVSPAGAQGLMQLMPGTANEMGVKDSFDPEQNIMGGTRYLRRMLDRYEGNLDKALSAYNWGPGNLDRMKNTLPEETRTYLSRVHRYLSEGAS